LKQAHLQGAPLIHSGFEHLIGSMKNCARGISQRQFDQLANSLAAKSTNPIQTE
jgi:hypothetical protein